MRNIDAEMKLINQVLGVARRLRFRASDELHEYANMVGIYKAIAMKRKLTATDWVMLRYYKKKAGL